MWKVPKKNISSRIADIIRPGRDGRRPARPPKPTANHGYVSNFAPARQSHPSPASRRVPIFRFAMLFLVGVLLVGGTMGYYAYRAKRITLASVGDQLQQFYHFLGRTDGAAVQGDGSVAPGEEPFSIKNFGEALSFIKNIGKNYKSFQTLSSSGLEVLSEVKTLERSLVQDAFSGKGEQVIARLERIQGLLKEISNTTQELGSNASFAATILPVGQGDFFDASVDLERINTFITGFISWLKADSPHHIVVFLENPSEVRPGGGFLGSYLELTIQKGSVTAMQVRDINEADRVFSRTIVPPQPLQLIVRRFRAADANWFFDFSESASTTLTFLEDSELYAKEDITLDAAIGISGRAVEDILALTGPVTLTDGTEIDAKNFLSVLQQSVQEGQAQGAANPKSILQAFAPELMKKIGTLSNDTDNGLLAHLGDWFSKREVRIYAREKTFESFFEAYNLAGTAYRIPEKFNGDYLAVASANIGGGKSDLFVKQVVSVESQLSEEGIVATHLTVSRTHTASTTEPWWYTNTNQSYLQVFTSPSASLEHSEGGSVKAIPARVDYVKEKYENLPRITTVEATRKQQLNYPAITVFKEDGKNVFATWLRTERGATSELTLSYKTKLPLPLKAGSTYQFVFEKQSGITGEYHFQINAPVGFVFEENNLPVYEFKSDDPPGRFAIALKLRALTAADF